MAASLLQLLKEFSARRGLPSPTVGVKSQDDQVIQLIGLLNEVLEDLTTRYVGTALQKQAAWGLLPQESQGKLTDLCPFGFKWIINDSFWDRTQRVPVLGPVNIKDWQAIKASPSVGVWLQYRVFGGELHLNGNLSAAAAGHNLVLEYASDWSVQSGDGTVFKPWFTADDDVSLFPDSILLAGLTWKWRLEKGFKYSEAFRSYEVLVTEFNGHDGGKKALSMSGEITSIAPGIFIPTGNWNVGGTQ